MYEIRTASLGDAGMAGRCRLEDAMEWKAGGSRDIGRDLGALIQFPGAITRTLTIAGSAEAIWGAHGTAITELGIAWMIATPIAEKHALGLHRRLAGEVGLLTARWPVIQCFADDRNTVHHRWIEWMGFELLGVIPYGPFGMLFRHYEKDAR